MDSRTSTDPTRGSRRALVAGALLVLTVAAGLAARQTASATPIPGGAAGPAGADALVLPTIADGSVGFRGRLDRGAVQVGGDGRVHLELVASGAERDLRTAERRPTDVIVVLDRSGSMGGEPLRKALASIRELVSQLDATDRFGLVTYANSAEQVLPLEAVSSAARSRWLSRIAAVEAGGGTNMSAGLDRAHQLLEQGRHSGRVARVLLLSDGHANQGDATPGGLSRRAGRAVHGEYVLSTVGVGEGFDERLMTRLADAGTGNFYYVPNVEVLAGIFADEFAAARETVASSVEVQIDTPGGVRVIDAAGYPLTHTGGYTSFRLGSLFAGQERTLWVTLSIPTSDARSISLGDVRLVYSDTEGVRRRAELAGLPAIAAVDDRDQFVAQLDASAVQERFSKDLVNRMRQSVGSSVGRGDYAAAKKALADVDYSEFDDLGIAKEETKAYELLDALRSEVREAEAAPRALQPQRQNSLGKQLYEQGTDGRRKGAKR